MDTTTSTDGTVIGYDRLGDGPPVVLVHPALGHRAFNPEMGRLAELLSATFTVFNYDRRGRGDSGDNAGPVGYDVQREIDDLAAMLTVAGGSAAVYGMSSGAALVLEAANRGLPITKLALYEPPFVIDDSRTPVPPGYLDDMVKLVVAGRRGEAAEHFFVKGVGVPAEAIPYMRADPTWAEYEKVAPTLIYDSAILEGTMIGHPLSPERTAAAKMPALILVGSQVEDWAHTSTKWLADTLEQGSLTTLDGEFHQASAESLAVAVGDFFTA
ncbi:alpha/beta fold hydrolase [Fodinicola feengrottensis]|uniref:Alpha/beta hydrolase n=1 Tax=Fodinicola feengrottensis TaxID=435914 RepID=A0ABP4RLC2_9ACTN|nr:alpha/beta hydrolase [Fodinicola feengrottensis]